MLQTMPRSRQYISVIVRPRGTIFSCSGSTSKSEGWSLSSSSFLASALACSSNSRRLLVCSVSSSSNLGESGTSTPDMIWSSVHPVSFIISWSFGVRIFVTLVVAQPPCFFRIMLGSS